MTNPSIRIVVIRYHAAELTPEHDRDAVADGGQFVEFIGNHDHRHTSCGALNDALARQLRVLQVQTVGWLVEDNKVCLRRQLSCEQNFLDVAARQLADRRSFRRCADIVALNLLPGVIMNAIPETDAVPPQRWTPDLLGDQIGCN